MVVKKYIQHSFSDNEPDNAAMAAEEIYVLLRKIKEAAGDRSEDIKAPLKSIRNAIASLTREAEDKDPSAVAAEIDSLFRLYRKLAEVCEDRITRGQEVETATAVREILRYRLTRLVTGDLWDATPGLKLRVLKLIFALMVQEKERLVADMGDTPTLRLSRSRSLGRRTKNDGLQAPRTSRWQESVDEVGKMPGNKILPLMKLLLMESMQRGGSPGAPSPLKASVQPPTPEQVSPPVTVGDPTIQDLLGLFDEAATTEDRGGNPLVDRQSSFEEGHAASVHSASHHGGYSAAAPPLPHRQFSHMSSAGQQQHKSQMGIMGGGSLQRPGSPSASVVSYHSGSAFMAPQATPVQAIPVNQDHYQRQASMQSHGSGSLPYTPSPRGYGYPTAMDLHRSGSLPLPVEYGTSQFDASSPYFGATHPCDNNTMTFAEVAPAELGVRQPVPAQQYPTAPMRPQNE